MNRLMRLKRRFLRNREGSMATIVAVVLPALIGFGVLAIDVGHYYLVRTQVQQAADLSALAVLQKMRDDDTRIDITTVLAASRKFRTEVINLANKNMPSAAKTGAVKESDVTFGKWHFDKKTFETDGNAFPVSAVRVEATLSADRNNPVKALFSKIYADHVDMSVDAVAVLPIPPAFHVLSADASGALEMRGSSDIDVWTVWINSTADDAFRFSAGRFGVGAAYVGVAGDMLGSPDNSGIMTGQTPMRDFLEDLPEPSFGGCDETNFVTSGPNPPNLRPGVYCGGLTITGAEEVTLEPGTYIITGGPLIIDASMKDKPIKGDDVLIYLADSTAELHSAGAQLSLRAKRTGKWAGVVLMAARDASAPANVSFTETKVYFSGIVHVPGSKVTLSSAIFNGICRYLCVVSDTFSMDGSFINYAPGMTRLPNPFGDTAQIPVEPPALRRSFRPYLVSEASAAGF